MIKIIASIILSLFSLSTYPSQKIERIENTLDLKIWCKSKTERFYLAKKIKPYNWTASWHTKGDILFVEGEWRIGSELESVLCFAKKGGKSKFAKFKFIKKP